MFLFDYLKGVAEYEIMTEKTEVFINKIKNDVSVKKLSLRQDSVHICVFYNERTEIERQASCSNCKITGKKVKGLPVLINRIKHRSGLVAGGLLSVLIVFFSSMFVWEIRVEGNENLNDYQVIEMLDKAGFREGMLKRSVDVKKVSDRLLINEDAVSWLAINFDGTVAHVEMKEAKIAEPYPKKENVNLVASANGIILRVDALEGGAAVSKGEAVTKGQLLVSAFVDKRTGGSMLRGARGFVWAKTQRAFMVTVPLEYSKRMYTDRVSKELYVTFLGKTFKIPHLFKSKTYTCDYEKNEQKMSLFDKIVLPVKTGLVQRREYNSYSAKRTTVQALETARLTAKERLHEISPMFALADIEEEYSVRDGKLVYTCTFEGVENIARELEFELS